MKLAQVNMRVPEDTREAVLAIGARLRADPAFIAQLQAFLDTLDDPTATPALADRVAALEARLDAIERGNP